MLLAPRAPRTVRTGYAYQPRAYRMYRAPWHPRCSAAYSTGSRPRASTRSRHAADTCASTWQARAHASASTACCPCTRPLAHWVQRRRAASRLSDPRRAAAPPRAAPRRAAPRRPAPGSAAPPRAGQRAPHSIAVHACLRRARMPVAWCAGASERRADDRAGPRGGGGTVVTLPRARRHQAAASRPRGGDGSPIGVGGGPGAVPNQRGPRRVEGLENEAE